jgi:hypothetical protein
MLMLSTEDNPYNPWLHYDEWYAWDVAHGYNLCSYLATLANTSESMNEEDVTRLVSEVTDEIISINIFGNIIGVPMPDDYKDE